MKIYCTNLQRYVDISGGEKLLDIYARIADEIPFRPICARVNRKTENLSFAVYHPKEVEFLPSWSASGERVYIRSLCMMLYRSITELYPGAHLRMEHSISRGYYCRITDSPTPPDAAAIKAKMNELVARDIPFVSDEKLTTDVIELFKRQGLESKIKLLESIHQLYSSYYELDGIYDSYYGALATSTGQLDVFDLLPYKEGFLLLGRDRSNPDVPQQPLTQEKMYKAFTDYQAFNNIVGVRTVGELNQAVEQGMQSRIINVSEALHDKYIARLSDEITRRYHDGGARIVLIAGPSSSGKTTTTKRLAIQLLTNLLKPQMISLDDYFIDREHTPRDADGDFDFESLYALDLKKFNADLTDILAGEEVELPYYNFEAGRREYRGHKIKLEKGSILLIEGIHGLNPELTAAIDEHMKYRIYVSALTTISIDDHNWVPTTDNRLLRRIVRDHKYRGMSARDTIARWPSVRRGEEKWIFPYQENADATFNSSLLYELSVLRHEAEELLATVPADCEEYTEAYRLRRFLQYFAPISADRLPSTSILREFLGGSSFKY